MNETSLSKTLCIGYLINPHGADHMDNLNEIFFSAFTENPNVTIPDAISLGFESAPYGEIGPRNLALLKAFQSKRIITDSLVLCAFLPYSSSQIAELTSTVTGWNTTVMEQFRIAERILTMCRMFNIREGFTAADDRLPARFFEPTKGGALADKSLNFEEMEKAKRYYYHLMGWDESGVPMTEKLEELGIDHLTTIP